MASQSSSPTASSPTLVSSLLPSANASTAPSTSGVSVPGVSSSSSVISAGTTPASTTSQPLATSRSLPTVPGSVSVGLSTAPPRLPHATSAHAFPSGSTMPSHALAASFPGHEQKSHAQTPATLFAQIPTFHNFQQVSQGQNMQEYPVVPVQHYQSPPSQSRLPLGMVDGLPQYGAMRAAPQLSVAPHQQQPRTVSAKERLYKSLREEISSEIAKMNARRVHGRRFADPDEDAVAILLGLKFKSADNENESLELKCVEQPTPQGEPSAQGMSSGKRRKTDRVQQLFPASGDIILEILGFLRVHELCITQRICKHGRSIAVVAIQRKTVIETEDVESAGFLGTVQRYCTNIRDLNFRGLGDCSQELDMYRIISKNRKLSTLRLRRRRWNKGRESDILRKIASCSLSLKCVNIRSSCFKESAILRFLKSCGHSIEKLHLTKDEAFDLSDLPQLCPRLQLLDIDSSTVDLSQVVQKCPNLTTLSVTGLHSDITPLFTSNNITTLDVSRVIVCSGKQPKRSEICLPNLTDLAVNCWAKEFSFIMFTPYSHRLKKLAMYYLDRPDDTMKFLRSCKNLEELRFPEWGNQFLVLHMMSANIVFTKLVFLEVNFDRLEAGLFGAVAPNLKTLWARRPCIDLESVRFLSLSKVDLRVLRLMGCVHHEAVGFLANNDVFPNLRELDLYHTNDCDDIPGMDIPGMPLGIIVDKLRFDLVSELMKSRTDCVFGNIGFIHSSECETDMY